MNKQTLINLLGEARFDAEVKIVKAWNPRNFSFDSSCTSITEARIGTEKIVLSSRPDETPLTVTALIGILNSFKGLDVLVDFNIYGSKPVDAVLIYDSAHSVYLCADEVKADDSETD